MKIGLTLCGGGIRGAAHIGALKALEEENIKFDVVAGTSSGSIVASLYAMNYTADEMIEIFNKFAKTIVGIGPQSIINSIKENLGFRIRGICSSYKIENILSMIANEKGISTLKDLKMPIAIPATDLIESEEIVFTNGEQSGKNYIKDAKISTAVRASSSFPGMYIPFEYEKYQFTDGGVLDGLPIKETKKLGADKVLAINFNILDNRKTNSVYNIIMKSTDIMTEKLIKHSLEDADYALNINLKGVRPFNLSKMKYCYKEGYNQAKEHIDKIKELIES